MKTLFRLLPLLLCLSASAQLYRPLFYSPMFSSTQSGTVSNIFLATNLVTAAPWLTMNTARILGRSTASAGVIEDITLGAGLSFSGTTLNGQVGTVTSVAMSVPAFLSIAGSPVTGSGTLAVSLSGTALPVANGGSGAVTLTGILKGNGVGAFTAASAGVDYVAPGAYTASGLTMDTARLLGRTTAGNGAAEEITVGSGLSLAAGTLTATGGGVALSAITAATGDNAIQNGAFNQLWRFTDPGTGEINLELTGTNSTASGLLYVRGQMTHATAVQTRFTESLASTGGSGAQDLVRIDTVASSTATPLALYSRANRVIEVGYNANQLWAANGALGANTYSFLNLKTGGMTYDGTYAIFGYDSGDFLRFDNNSMLMFVSGGGQATLNNNGFGANDGGANAVQFNTGNGSNPGIEYNVRVKTTTTGSVSLSASISGGNSTGPGSIQNNSGASAGVTYNLPAAVIGNCYTFTVMDTDGITIDCNGTDTIQFNATATSAGGTIASATVGNTVTIICVDTGKWIVTSYVGTIAVTWTTT